MRALRRRTIRKSPTRIVKSATGTSERGDRRAGGRQTARSQHRGRRAGRRRRWSIDGRSRRAARPRAAPRPRAARAGAATGTATPLSRGAAQREQPRRSASSRRASSGSRPSSTPWNATRGCRRRAARAQQRRSRRGTRPAPADVSTRVLAIAGSPQDREQRQHDEHRAAEEELRHAQQTQARHRRLDDADRDAPRRSMPAMRDAARRAAHAPVRTGTTTPDEQRAEHPQLERRAVAGSSARSGPPWSSTITSWIIVSSRCVFGSSTGMRAFSARKTTNSAAATRTSDRGGRAQPPADAASDAREREAARRVAPAARGQQQRGLGERGERHLAAGAHALEGRAGVERGEDRDEARQRQQVGEEDEVAAGTRSGAARRRTGTSSDAATTPPRGRRPARRGRPRWCVRLYTAALAQQLEPGRSRAGAAAGPRGPRRIAFVALMTPEQQAATSASDVRMRGGDARVIGQAPSFHTSSTISVTAM